MARTYQQEVTRQQVLHKRQEAIRDVEDSVRVALNARTGAEYEEAVRKGFKAIQDHETWSKVLPSL